MFGASCDMHMEVLVTCLHGFADSPSRHHHREVPSRGSVSGAHSHTRVMFTSRPSPRFLTSSTYLRQTLRTRMTRSSTFRPGSKSAGTGPVWRYRRSCRHRTLLPSHDCHTASPRRRGSHGRPIGLRVAWLRLRHPRVHRAWRKLYSSSHPSPSHCFSHGFRRNEPIALAWCMRACLAESPSCGEPGARQRLNLHLERTHSTSRQRPALAAIASLTLQQVLAHQRRHASRWS